MADDYDSDDLFFQAIISKAEMMAMLSILDELCHQLGYRDPDGLSLHDRFYKQRVEELESVFRSLEDGNPGLAARLHDRFEDAKKRLGEGRY